MSEQMKQDFCGLMYAIGARQVHKLQEMQVPPIPKGNQKANGIKVGDTVEALSSSTRKAGTRGKVTDKYKQHGYWYYVCDSGMGVQRQQDIRKV